MKTFKGFIKEASGFPTGPVGENPNNLAGEVTNTLGSDVFNPDNFKELMLLLVLLLIWNIFYQNTQLQD